MKKFIIAAAVMMSSGLAMADGFICNTNEGDLTIKVYNKTQPEMGTRNAAVMVVSDPAVAAGNKTIAVFKAVKGRLTQQASKYVGDGDLRFVDLRRGGENILGTKLKYVDTLTLDVDFTYAAPVADGAEVSAAIVLLKRNGEEINRDATCVRYLKRG